MTAYDIAKILKEHRLLIRKLAQAPYVCRCKPENLEPCEACDTQRLYRDLEWLLDNVGV